VPATRHRPTGATVVGVSPYRLVDFWHLVEKLGRAASVLAGAEAASGQIERWKLMLLNRKKAAGAILEELRSSGREWTRVGDEHPVHDAITYLA